MFRMNFSNSHRQSPFANFTLGMKSVLNSKRRTNPFDRIKHVPDICIFDVDLRVAFTNGCYQITWINNRISISYCKKKNTCCKYTFPVLYFQWLVFNKTVPWSKECTFCANNIRNWMHVFFPLQLSILNNFSYYMVYIHIWLNLLLDRIFAPKYMEIPRTNRSIDTFNPVNT